jgi:thiol-disulfide isomerase/thioredoxin
MLAALTAATAVLLLGLAAPAKAVQLGQPMPEVLLDTPDGPRQLLSAQARLTYVDFWASWCGPCRQSFPWMNAMQAKYGASGLRIVAVSVDAKRADADQFLLHNPATFAIAFDRAGAFAKSTDVKTMPTSLLLDHRGRVLLVHQGFANKDRETLEAAIADALRDAAAGGKP